MSESAPSLHVYRRALNLTDRVFDTLLSVASINGMPTPDPGSLSPYANILSPGELRAAVQRQNPSREIMDELGDQLEQQLPESAEQAIQVPTFPLLVSFMRKKPNRKFIVAATQNPTILAEREFAQSLVGTYFQLPDPAILPNDQLTYVRIARFSQDPLAHAASKFQSFIQRHPDLLPPAIEFGPVNIDNVDV